MVVSLLPPPRQWSRYQIESSLTQRMIQLQHQQHSQTRLRWGLMDAIGPGICRVCIETLSRQHRQPLLMYQLSDDLESVMRELVFRTDEQGELQAVLNLNQLQREWALRGHDLRRKYSRLPQAHVLFGAFETGLRTGVSLLKGYQHRCPHGLVQAGIWGHYSTQTGVVVSRVIPDFFNQLALPLVVERWLEQDGQDWVLRGRGSLDTDRFDGDSFRRQMRQAVNMYNLDVEMAVSYEEEYRLSGVSKRLLGGRQWLRAEACDVYEHESEHRLVLSEEL